MQIESIQSVYFVGAGGIGMSALIRYFLHLGKQVAGYDKTPTGLTEQLNEEGAFIHYEDSIDLIPDNFLDPKTTLIVYTPAIPDSHSELSYFRANNFQIMKRAQVLGQITDYQKGICIAGTHGKTTTSSMTAHLLKQSHVDCNAFLGGILKNYDSNLLLSSTSDLTVVEADEFDRSFHWLHPYMAVITSIDPDHLDIYGTEAAYRDSFVQFTTLIRPGGCLLLKKGLTIVPKTNKEVHCYTYSGSESADFYAENIRIEEGDIHFDFVAPDVRIEAIQLGVPVLINVENAVAAIALAWLNGVTEEEIKRGMASFQGPKRRFDFHLKKKDAVLIDDYAHHPEELKASIQSVRALYPNRQMTGIFQPHLYSRTQDFSVAFASSLSLLDELILLDIYPAREEPIPGVTSALIFDQVTIGNKKMITMDQLLPLVQEEVAQLDVVLMVGAGNIEQQIEPVKLILENK